MFDVLCDFDFCIRKILLAKELFNLVYTSSQLYASGTVHAPLAASSYEAEAKIHILSLNFLH